MFLPVGVSPLDLFWGNLFKFPGNSLGFSIISFFRTVPGWGPFSLLKLFLVWFPLLFPTRVFFPLFGTFYVCSPWGCPFGLFLGWPGPFRGLPEISLFPEGLLFFGNKNKGEPSAPKRGWGPLSVLHIKVCPQRGNNGGFHPLFWGLPFSKKRGLLMEKPFQKRGRRRGLKK